jgi:glutathione S-transferase
MLKLFHTPTTRSLRVVWLLEELGLPYEVQRLKFPPRLNEPSFLDINPSGTLPALADGHLLLTESMAICDHLAMKEPEAGLIPMRGEAEYPAYLKWLWFGEATLMFAVSLISRSRRSGLDQDHPLVVDTFGALDARLADLEKGLAGRDFIACGRLTLADISCAFALYRMDEMKIADRMGPATRAYYDRLRARPAFAKALTV